MRASCASITAPALATPGVLVVLTGADLVADGLKALSHRPVPTNLHEVPLKTALAARDGAWPTCCWPPSPTARRSRR
jgi:hypothetical protein